VFLAHGTRLEDRGGHEKIKKCPSHRRGLGPRWTGCRQRGRLKAAIVSGSHDPLGFFSAPAQLVVFVRCKAAQGAVQPIRGALAHGVAAPAAPSKVWLVQGIYGSGFFSAQLPSAGIGGRRFLVGAQVGPQRPE